MDVILAATEKKKKSDVVVNDLPLEENLNRLETEGDARSVEEAISVLRLVFVSIQGGTWKIDEGLVHTERKLTKW